MIISAVVLLSTAGSIARTGAEVAGRAVSVIAANSDPLTYQIDTLLRPLPATPAGSTPAASAPTTYASGEVRSELLRIMAKSVTVGSLAPNDRTYLSSVVAQRTGIAQPEAERRVDEAYAEAARATKQAADTARRTALLAGFVTAASLLISLAAAWWAGIRGGHHRDNAIPARFFPAVARRPV